MSCFKCKHDGTVICDPTEAELRCMVCGRCDAEAEVAQTLQVHQTTKWPKYPESNK